jgi:hypothetical protein
MLIESRWLDSLVGACIGGGWSPIPPRQTRLGGRPTGMVGQ